MSVEWFLKKFSYFIARFQESVITKGRRVIFRPFKMDERRQRFMENSQELIGILQAISIVAKSLAVKLMKIDREIREYESARAGTWGRRKMKKGK